VGDRTGSPQDACDLPQELHAEAIVTAFQDSILERFADALKDRVHPRVTIKPLIKHTNSFERLVRNNTKIDPLTCG
jgi:hypothetical protein